MCDKCGVDVAKDLCEEKVRKLDAYEGDTSAVLGVWFHLILAGISN